jgi:hypothetical protein
LRSLRPTRAARCPFGRGRLTVAQRRQESPRYFFAQILRAAADAHALGLELRRILDRVQETDTARNLRLQYLRFLAQLFKMLFPSAQNESLDRAVRFVEAAIGP